MLVALATECGVRIATAESCTGGLIASSIVDIPGCSEIYSEGLVTYSNEAKVRRLGVDPATLQEFGAVSAETAVEMANGLLAQGADIGISVTGIAGIRRQRQMCIRDRVYIAVGSERHTDVYRHIFKGNRRSVRRQSANMAMFYTIQHLKNYY